MRRRTKDGAGQSARERAFTVRALVLSVLLFRDGIGIRDLREEMEAITGGVEVGNSAVFAAGKALESEGLVVGVKAPRPSGGGPPTLVFRITERGREAAEDMRQQAERLLYWPKLKRELGRRSGTE